jgi:NAD(P)-dependent dehydrogenase (short-subunit alcohol dehydrogenase family)
MSTNLPEGLRAVVTGAGGGLGRAFAEALGRRRAVVLVSDVQLEGAEETAARVRQAGGQAEVLRCDVRQADEVEALAAHMDTRHGGTDLVVNNAGVAVAGRVGEVAVEDWRWIVDINLLGVAYGCHAFVPRFRRQGRGYVINVASAAGLVSMPTMAPYNATKAAVVALSETLAAECHGSGVHVTVLCPTFFQTNILRDARVHAPRDELAVAETRMQRSRLQADGVAEAALASVARDQLYCVPMADGRWVWRLKRSLPGLFPGLVARADARLRGRREG